MNTNPQNVFKHCLRCGSDAVTYKADNSLLCEKCGFHHYINSVAAVAVLLTNNKGELLLTKRGIAPEKGKLDLPGGFVDIGESAEIAVARELYEELNVQVDNVHYLASYPNEYLFSGVTIFTLDMAFACNIRSFEEIMAKDDVADFAFYPLEDIDLDEIAFASIRNIVRDFKKRLENK